jgi:hypothetical protein
MAEYTGEIKEFFGHRPRFNVVLIKGEEVNEKELSKELNFEAIDIQKLVAEERLKIEKIDGYTDFLELLKYISNGVTKEGALINPDLLLSCLNKEKRRYFFESVLQKTFPKPIILITSIFMDEVPDVSHQEFNYAKVVEWRG